MWVLNCMLQHRVYLMVQYTVNYICFSTIFHLGIVCLCSIHLLQLDISFQLVTWFSNELVVSSPGPGLFA